MKALESYLKSNFEYFLNEDLVKNFIQTEVLRLVSSNETSIVFESRINRFLELNYIFRTIKNNEQLNKNEIAFYKNRINLFIKQEYFRALEIFASNYSIDDVENASSLKAMLDIIIKKSINKVEIHLPLSENKKYIIENIKEIRVDFYYLKNDYSFSERKLINLLRKVSTVIGIDNFCESSTSSPNSIKRYYKNSNEKIEAVTEISGDLNIKILSNILNKYADYAKIY